MQLCFAITVGRRCCQINQPSIPTNRGRTRDKRTSITKYKLSQSDLDDPHIVSAVYKPIITMKKLKIDWKNEDLAKNNHYLQMN